MADGLISIFLGKLVSIIQQDIQEELRLVTGVREDVEKLSRTLRSIQAVLKDAEERQVKDNLVMVWLENLKDIAYDTDDVLDEWSTKILMLKEVRPNNNLLSCCFWFKQVGLHRDIGLKIKKINKRLDEITSEEDKFNFKSSSNVNTEEPINRPQIRQTSSLIDVSITVGRNSEKELIVSKLLTEGSWQETTSVPIISIVGMGGLGKTTLAQLVFNDNRITAQFEKKIWVCVFEPFDKVRIAKEIIKAFHKEILIDNDISWEALHNLLTDSLENRLFLLVLDDMWTEDVFDWDPLKLSLNFSAQGSRILVTTRKTTVATMLGTTYLHNLELLSDPDCWSLMSRIAFAERATQECQMLEGIGREIAKKCKGLPLSAKSIGGLLRFKRPRKHDWQDVLESHTWEEVQEHVLPALLLSYYDLPSHLKQCFAYCAIFPKDKWIYKDELVKLWMAQGFLINNSSSERDMELIGEEYFDILAMRSFFQDFRKDYNQKIECKMHDLIHDLSQFLTNKECSVLNISNNIALELNYSNARHLVVIQNYKDGLDEVSIPPLVFKAKNLRTLILPMTISVSSDLFLHLTCLRALSLSVPHLRELPNEVEKLVHLRYLDLSSTRLKELPETLGNLYNLQTLELNFCGELYNLPEGITKLTKMRHLEIRGTEKLQYLPQGIGRLISLRRLSKFIIGGNSATGREGCTIKELKDLKFLQGGLEIRGLGRLKSENDTNYADLKNRKHIHKLGLYFDGCNGQFDAVGKMESILEGLQPHQALEGLGIGCYPGTKLAGWMVRDNGLPNLRFLRFYACKNLNMLPPAIGKLPSLERLSIKAMDEIKYMGHRFFGINSADAAKNDCEAKKLFPKLDSLNILDMKNLEDWVVDTEEIETTSVLMPHLSYLYIHNCPKLKVLPHHIFPAAPLQTLLILQCPQLTWTPSSSSLLQHLQFLNLSGDVGDLSRSLPSNNKIMDLTIQHSPFRSLPTGLENFTELKSLCVYACEYIDCIPDELLHLTSLKKLEIVRCPLLEECCRKEVGKDWKKICHIPHIEINERRIQ